MSNESMLNFPEELRKKPNWVCRGVARFSNPKIPVQVTGEPASSTDSSTWSSYTAAQEACKTLPADGVGFVFDRSGYFGVDIDHCINRESGEASPIAKEIIDLIDSYTEYSPSGTGVHIFCKGRLPDDCPHKSKLEDGQGLEVYDTERYFTVTGQPFGRMRPLRDATTEAEKLIARLMQKKRSNAHPIVSPIQNTTRQDAESVLERIRRSARANEFFCLYTDGNTAPYGDDHSAADMALCNMLAYWTYGNTQLMDALFRRSALMRDKWDEQHGEKTYGAMTIEHALDSPFLPFDSAYADVFGYLTQHGTTYHVSKTQDGERRTPLANFVALPVEEITRDNGIDTQTEFLIKGITSSGKPLPQVSIPAAKFASMNWVYECWNLAANIYPGQAVKDKLRFAIQEAGKDRVTHRTIYTHTGWKKINGAWCFLYHGGAIGCDDVSVELKGTLEAYNMPDESGSMRVSLKMLDVLPARIAVPLLGHIFLAPLCSFMECAGCVPAYTLFLAGSSGAKKSTAAALALSHFGHAFDNSHLPANFHCTANSLREMSFILKDVPLLVDDFHPVSDLRTKRIMDGIAQELSRAWGDRAARNKLGADSSMLTPHPPRGLGMMTGESEPDVSQSGLARFFTVDVRKTDIAITEELSALQQQAVKGAFAASMRSYIEWLIPQCEKLPQVLRAKFEAYRAKAREALSSAHDRQPSNVAWLLTGYDMFLSCMVDRKELDETTALQMLTDGLSVLAESVAEQSETIRDETPIRLFLDTLYELKAAGKVTLINKDTVPADAPLLINRGENMIGYTDDDRTYLHTMAAYSAVFKALQDGGQAFPISKNRLWKSMSEQGLIETESSRTTKRMKICGVSGSFIVLINEKVQALLDN